MGKSLDEFIEGYPSVKFLQENLRVNIDTFAEDMTNEEKEQFLRMNMIMVRQCLKDFGAT